MAIKRIDRWHAALHLAWAGRGGPAPFWCRLLMRYGAFDCGSVAGATGRDTRPSTRSAETVDNTRSLPVAEPPALSLEK